MARVAALLCLCGLLAVAGVASAATCVESPDHPFDAEYDPDQPDLGACKKCSDDNSTCVECWVGYSLNSTGLCDRCEPFECAACTPGPDGKMNICSDCTMSWDEPPEVGSYAEANGTCVPCKTPHCMECTNVNATNPTSTCIRCATGMGVMPDGSCQPCDDADNCLWCDGDKAKCTECMSDFFIQDGKCTPCPTGCSKCTNATVCLECNYSVPDTEQGLVLDAATGKCVPCASEGCSICSTGPDACESCNTGYTNTTDGKACVKCTDPHCTTCAPGKPDVCEICAMFNQTSDKLQWGVDKATGKCVDCRIEHCASCQDDADTCDWCDDGFWNDLKNKKCVPCGEVLEHCTSCSTNGMEDTPTFGQAMCDTCEKGWEVDDATYKCVKSGGKA